jgi:hypothetical protein
VPRIKRTLDGAEIDTIIAEVQAHKAMAIEHWRQTDWRKRELAAGSFRADCNTPSAYHCHCHILHQIRSVDWRHLGSDDWRR